MSFINFDYSITGIILMMIFYLCRNKPALGAALYFLSYLPAFWGDVQDPLALVVGGHAISFEAFSLLALPLIYLKTNSGLKISKWVFYLIYPGTPAADLSAPAVDGIRQNKGGVLFHKEDASLIGFAKALAEQRLELARRQCRLHGIGQAAKVSNNRAGLLLGCILPHRDKVDVFAVE